MSGIAVLKKISQGRPREGSPVSATGAPRILPPEDSLAHVPDPMRLTREQCLRYVLLPDVRAGRLPGFRSEAELRRHVATTSESVIQLETAEQMRREPWPADVQIPSFAEFVSSAHYLDQPNLTPRQKLSIETAFGPSAYDWYARKRETNAAFLVYGKGSGKDWMAVWVTSYASYVIASMRNPWWHFGTILDDAMEWINVAQDAGAARKNFFTRLKSMLKRPCYQRLLDRRPDRDILTESVQFRRYLPERGQVGVTLRILSLNSLASSVEGSNVIGWVFDEADALQDSEGNQKADSMLNTVRTSNRFGSQQIGLGISWPRDPEGFMMTNLAKCGNRGGEVRGWYGDLAATYEVLPWKVYIPCRKDAAGRWQEIRDPGELDGTEYYTNDEWKFFVPARGAFLDGRWCEKDSEMADIYRNDPETFNAMYRCRPAAGGSNFYGMPERIKECVTPWLKPVADLEPGLHVQMIDGAERRYVKLDLTAFRIRPNTSYYVGADAGETQDSFAMCFSHIVPPRERGFICPACWNHAERRYAKHYQPEPLPASAEWVPLLWRCDHCSAVPAQEPFWGVCHPAGREIEMPIVEGYSANGEPKLQRVEPWNPESELVLQTTWLPVVVEDLLLEWVPDRKQQLTVWFQSALRAVLDFHAAAQRVNSRVAYARFDRAEMVLAAQEIREAGIPCETVSMSNPEQMRIGRGCKTLVYNHLVQLLPGQDRAREQMRRLIKIGERLDHPKGGAKDLYDAEAISFDLACRLGVYGVSDDYHEGQPGATLQAIALEEQAREEIDPDSIIGETLRGLGLGF